MNPIKTFSIIFFIFIFTFFFMFLFFIRLIHAKNINHFDYDRGSFITGNSHDSHLYDTDSGEFIENPNRTERTNRTSTKQINTGKSYYQGNRNQVYQGKRNYPFCQYCTKGQTGSIYIPAWARKEMYRCNECVDCANRLPTYTSPPKPYKPERNK